MTTLAADAIRKFELGDESDVPAVAADIIYQGAAVGDNGSGYGRPLNAGDPFRGFALKKCDNSAGAAGAKYIKVRRKGDVVLSISAAAITDVGKDVYASDDDTFTFTQGSNTRIGHVKRWISTGLVVVAFHENVSDIAELTDNSGGTASDTLAAITGSYVEATIENTVASLAAKINEIIRRLGG